MEKEQKKYEIGFLAKTENDREEIIKVLNSQQAEIYNNGSISLIKLAYPIKKQITAYFGYIQFSAFPAVAKKLQDSLKLNSQILRFLIISSPVEKSALIPRIRPAVAPKKIIAEKPIEIKKPKSQPILSNEALEKKLEEILK